MYVCTYIYTFIPVAAQPDRRTDRRTTGQTDQQTDKQTDRQEQQMKTCACIQAAPRSQAPAATPAAKGSRLPQRPGSSCRV